MKKENKAIKSVNVSKMAQVDINQTKEIETTLAQIKNNTDDELKKTEDHLHKVITDIIKSNKKAKSLVIIKYGKKKEDLKYAVKLNKKEILIYNNKQKIVYDLESKKIKYPQNKQQLKGLFLNQLLIAIQDLNINKATIFIEEIDNGISDK